MAIVQQTADDKVIIEDGSTRYKDTRANLETDWGATLDEVPDGFKARVYEQGGRHYFLRDNGERVNLVDGSIWLAGDLLVTDLADIIAAKATRLAA